MSRENAIAEAPAIESGLRALLAQRPEALVVAANGDGQFVPVPACLSVSPVQIPQGRTGSDMVRPADRSKVVEAWHRAQRYGGARVTVRLATPDEPAAWLHLFDVTATLGVHIAVLLPCDDDEEEVAETTGALAPRPRSVRAQKDEWAAILRVEDGVTAMLGWTPEELIGHRSLDFLHPEDQERSINAWIDVLARPGGIGRCRVRHQHRDGRWVWLELSNWNRLDDPDSGFVECEISDISDEMAAHEELRASEQLLRRLTQALPVGVLQLDADKVPVYVNDPAYRILGATPSTNASELAKCISDWSGMDATFDAVYNGADADLEMYIDRADGSGRRRCTMAFRPLTGSSGEVTGAVLCITDVTDAARMRNELETRATFDALTGCVNRSTAVAALADALARSAHTTATIFVDLDHFKLVNDKFGHAVGDTVLIAVAARLRDSVRGDDIVGRLGGDEFLVICPDVTSDRDAMSLAERVASTLAEPLEVNGISLGTLASVGVARASSSHTSAEGLIAEADAAMYESKRIGAGRAVLNQGATPQIRPSDGVGTWLRKAIDDKELAVHFQPIVTAGDGRVMGSEALLRWHRNGRLVPAGEFIAAAETTGLICEIGAWVIHEVCHQAVASKQSDMRWFLNLSPRELAAPRTIEAFHRALESSGIPASSLVVEITERAALMEGGAASHTIATLTDMGIGVALDDFGTGWSSLASLLSVPAQWLKIDKQFTAAATTNQGEALIGGIVDLAARVGCCTIAEGIETELEREAVARLGVHYAQGYLFGRPAALPDARGGR